MTIRQLIAAGMVWIVLPGAAHAVTVPDIALFEDYARFESLMESDRTAAFDHAAALLERHDEPDLRLALARAALDAGEAAVALDFLDGVAGRLSPGDARVSEAHDMAGAAHLALDDAQGALAAAIAAYEAAVERLGEDNPALLGRLADIEQIALGAGLAVPPVVAEARARFEQPVERERAMLMAPEPTAVTVWFGTNRVSTGEADPAAHFGRDLGSLETGRLTVTIPPGHRSGVIERPSAWSFTDHLDPMRHVVLAGIEPLAREVFAAGCCGEEDRLLFVHGYNVSFHDGALRAAQLYHDLEFRGQAMYYSWPSRGTLLGYLTDANNVLATRPALVDFLEIATRGEGTLHVIAHSMGNRYLLEALEVFLREYPDRRLGHLVLGAPDVDRDELSVRFPVLRERAAGVTLYASQHDLALLVSRHVHGRPRAGDSHGGALQLAGLDTVDASDIEADTLGHSYFGDAPQVLADILGLVRMSLAPGSRCGTALREESVWALRSDGCRIEELRVVGDLVTLYGEEARTVALERQADAIEDDTEFWRGVMALLDAQLSAD